MPLIDTTAYKYTSTVKSQDRVDRQREALGLERHTGSDHPTAGPSGMSSSRTGHTRYRSINRDRDLRNTIRRATSSRDLRTLLTRPSGSTTRRSRSLERRRSSYHSTAMNRSRSSRSRSPVGRGRGLKRISGTDRDRRYCGPAEEKMAAMRRKLQADKLDDQRKQLEKEKQEVARQRKEQDE